MKNERTKGTIIAYITVILQIIINIFFIPLLIKGIGIEEYGLYETINSLGNTLLLMNFGVTSIVSRYIVKFNKENNQKALENFLSMSAIITAVTGILIIMVGAIYTTQIDELYSNTLTNSQITKAKIMLVYIITNLSIASWRNYTSGIIVGYEKYSFSSKTKLLRQILRITILSILLLTKIDSMDIVITDLVITIILILTELVYCFKKLKVRIKFYKFDWPVLKEVFLFSLASIIQTITNQINLTLDKIILGVMTNTKYVAIYAIGMLIVNVMVSILQIINGMYLPEATKLVLEKADGEKFTDLIIKPGRIQSFIGCGIVFGFLTFGKEFIGYWVGSEFKEVWSSTGILLFFTMLTYVTSVANVILDAMLKKMYRSLILIATAILNIIMTIILVPKMGYLGAAIGTAASMFIGNIVLLNAYYSKKIKINIFRMYKNIFKGILPSAISALLVAFPAKLLINNDLLKLIITGSIFILMYLLSLIKYGLNFQERNFVYNSFKKILNIFKRKYKTQ